MPTLPLMSKSLVFLTLEDKDLKDSRDQYMCLETDEATVAVVKEKLRDRYGIENATGIRIYRAKEELGDEEEVNDGEKVMFDFADCVEVRVNLQNGGSFCARFPRECNQRYQRYVLATHFCACLEKDLDITQEGENELTIRNTPTVTNVKIYCGETSLDCPFPKMAVEDMRYFASDMLAWKPFLIAVPGGKGSELRLVSAKKDVQFDLPSGVIDRTIRLETEWTAKDLCTWGNNELGLKDEDGWLRIFHGNKALEPDESIAFLETSGAKLILSKARKYTFVFPDEKVPPREAFLWPHFRVCGVQDWLSKSYRTYSCILTFGGQRCDEEETIGHYVRNESDQFMVEWGRDFYIKPVTGMPVRHVFLCSETAGDVKEYCISKIPELSDRTTQNLWLFSWYRMYSDDVFVRDMWWSRLYVVPSDWKFSCDIDCGNDKHIQLKDLDVTAKFLDLIKKAEEMECKPCDLWGQFPGKTKRECFDPDVIVAWAVLNQASNFHVCSPMRQYMFEFESEKIIFRIELNRQMRMRDVKSELAKFFSIPDGWEMKKQDGSGIQENEYLFRFIRDETKNSFRVCYQGEAKLRLPLKKGGMDLSIPLPLSSKVQDLITGIDRSAAVTFTRQSETIFADPEAFLYETVITSDQIEVSVNRQDHATRPTVTIPVFRSQDSQKQSPIQGGPASPPEKVSRNKYTIISVDCECVEWEFPADATIQNVINQVKDVLKLENFQLCDFESGEEGVPYDPSTLLTDLRSKDILVRQNESKPETPPTLPNSEPNPPPNNPEPMEERDMEAAEPMEERDMEAAEDMEERHMAAEDGDSRYTGRKIKYTFVLDDDDFTLDVPEDAPISWVREQIARERNQDYERVQVFFASRSLGDDVLLSRARLPPGYKLPVILRDISEILIRTAHWFRNHDRNDEDE